MEENGLNDAVKLRSDDTVINKMKRSVLCNKGDTLERGERPGFVAIENQSACPTRARWPVAISRSVVFPAPFGPTSATTLFMGMEIVHSFSTVLNE